MCDHLKAEDSELCVLGGSEILPHSLATTTHCDMLIVQAYTKFYTCHSMAQN